METTVGQLQQTDAPGVSIAVFLQAEEVAVGRVDICSDEDRPFALEDFIMGPDADTGEVLLVVVGAGGGDGVLEDVVDGFEGQGEIEEIVEEFLTPRRELWEMRAKPRASCRIQGLVTGSQKRTLDS